VKAAKALGGSSKLVTLAPKTKGDDLTAQGNIKESIKNDNVIWQHI